MSRSREQQDALRSQGTMVLLCAVLSTKKWHLPGLAKPDASTACTSPIDERRLGSVQVPASILPDHTLRATPAGQPAARLNATPVSEGRKPDTGPGGGEVHVRASRYMHALIIGAQAQVRVLSSCCLGWMVGISIIHSCSSESRPLSVLLGLGGAVSSAWPCVSAACPVSCQELLVLGLR